MRPAPDTPAARPGPDVAPPSGSAGDPRPAPSGFDRIFRTTLVLIPIGVLGNIAFSLLTTDQARLTSLGERPVGYLALAVLLGLLPWATNAVRMLIWTRFLGYRQIGLRDTFEMTLGFDLGSAISPTAVGGGFFKWGMLVQRGVSPGAAASITTFPVIEDAIFFALALPVAVLYSASWDLPVFQSVAVQLRGNVLTVLAVAVAIGVATWLAIRWMLLGRLGRGAQRRGVHLLARLRRRLRNSWRDAREVFRLIARDGKLRFALSLALTGVQWAARYSVISALIAYLGAPVQPVLFWVLQWVVFTLTVFIPTPGGAGGAEAAFLLIYSAFIPREIIGLATAGWRFLTFYLQLGLAAILFFLLNLRARRRAAGQSLDRPAKA